MRRTSTLGGICEGRVLAALQKESPNQDARPKDEVVRLVVLHGISLPAGVFGGDAVEHLFCNRLDVDAPEFLGLAGLRVSSHFFIRRSGDLVQFVSCDRRAWHAGVSRWRGSHGCNDFSIGIELEGMDTTSYTHDQYEILGELLTALGASYPITDVVGHSDVAPGRKTDPGPFFDWALVRRCGLAR